MTQIDLEAIEARCEAARHEVNRLCQGKTSWTMSIPVRQDDTDVILTDAFRDILVLLAEAKRLRASLEAVLEEATSDLDRDIIITKCRSALAEVKKEI